MVLENPLVKKRSSSYSQARSISRRLVKTINTFKFDRQLTNVQVLKKLLLILTELRCKPSCLARAVKILQTDWCPWPTQEAKSVAFFHLLFIWELWLEILVLRFLRGGKELGKNCCNLMKLSEMNMKMCSWKNLFAVWKLLAAWP